MTETTDLRKEIPLDTLLQHLPQIEDIDYWRNLNPGSTISDYPWRDFERFGENQLPIAKYISQLQEEGYFQTDPVIPTATVQEMFRCIENVKKARLPVMFALIYDVFYQVFKHFNPILSSILGVDYQIIPNFWVYYIDTVDTGKGFEPHRDAEYANTIAINGNPTVLTLWIPITEATPLNSCMYIVPANRDPQYTQAIQNLKTKATQFALEDIRALPAKAGSLACWDQYVFHWGSRSSQRATHPRISYALYCQRGDMPPVDDVAINLRSALNFQTRLGLIYRGLYRYSYLSLQTSKQSEDLLLTFLKKHMESLST